VAKRKNTDDLWERFYSGDDRALNDLVKHYSYLVDKIVNIMAAGLPTYVDKDDLYSEGMIGLMDAIMKFTDKGYQFSTYAPFRIRGAILDFLRKNDWATRALRSKHRQLEQVIDDLSAKNGEVPHINDVAEYLEVDVESLHQIMAESSWASHIYLDEMVSEDSGEMFSAWDLIEDVQMTDTSLDYEDLMERLSDTMYELSEQERSVFAMYYMKGVSLKEIGDILGVTESRACQIHTRTLDKIRSSWSVV
jgi:RNA polymerase sigma factor for flagellar operon FliA